MCCITFVRDALRSNRWRVGINVDPIEGAFVINIGDMMSLWTNGMYRSTPHRVLRPAARNCPSSRSGENRGRMQRLSVPFFFEPNYDAFIEPLSPAGLNDSPPPGITATMLGRSRGITYGQHLVSKTESNFDFSGSTNSKL
eukprot:COSAG02_NODE_14852_length_1229_cov_3.684488_1_plen_141_part_00